MAWHSGNSGGMTHRVGMKAPNGYGLYDMTGNVYEWCWDILWGSDPNVIPYGMYVWETNYDRAIKGGSFLSSLPSCYVSAFDYVWTWPDHNFWACEDEYDGGYPNVGFRVVRNPWKW